MYKNIEKIVLGVFIIGFCTVSGWAADNQLTPAEKKAGFVSIFNGRNLTGWDGDPRLWSVKDGAIRGETTKENPAHGNTFCVWRAGKLKNFILKMKIHIRDGNSGIQYRSRESGKWRVAGYQAEVDDRQGRPGALFHEGGRGWLVLMLGDLMIVERDKENKVQKNVVSKFADMKELIKIGYCDLKGWNDFTIICRGNHIIHMVNGFQTIEMIDNDPKGRLMEGILAMQLHSGPPMMVEFKDIRVKHLSDNFGMAKRLFNGQDLNNWALSSPKLKDTWTVKDGLMINSGKPVGYIRTKSDFTNYILRLQFRHKGKGNGGVLLRMVGPDKVWPRSIEAQGQAGSAGDIWNIGKFPMKVDQKRTKGRHTVKLHKTNEKPNQWNQYEITMNKGNLELKVNELVQNTATQCWETPGKIGLQSEGSPMEFRNIVLIPIN